ncbi:GntR family transcriptional regulator [Neolewinella agarilytica]|uniref:Transcriptional regulator, GntR family n=1 Tax=Neolewinella agarilytica TaxID=478744 RepID=A0A1H9D781_9BACT|nr:GntR family transcriptional regulator [Neolewinella agarilytica]SEQ09284.1 transcriptional regulator, GntR family [Neolewinella agarilytica]
MEILKHITIDEDSRTPKYRQIVDSIIENIGTGKLKINEKIPSINMLSEEFSLSRDTVEKAYNILKERRIITSVKGKGFYVVKTPLISKLNVLFLINKLSAYKMRIYNSFIAAIAEEAHTELNIYHCDESLFLKLLSKAEKSYDFYVIMPHFKTNSLKHASTTDEVSKALNAIPAHKLLILDNYLQGLEKKCAQLYQDFENDIYEALIQGQDKISRYKKLVIAYPSNSVYPYPKRILHGFRKFCVEAKMPFAVIEEIEEDMPLEPGSLYLTIPETDLVNVTKAARDQGLILGKDVGIMSYNETPLKELLGITTISTDFSEMGRMAAEMIINKRQEEVKNPFTLLDRDSL